MPLSAGVYVVRRPTVVIEGAEAFEGLADWAQGNVHNIHVVGLV